MGPQFWCDNHEYRACSRSSCFRSNYGRKDTRQHGRRSSYCSRRHGAASLGTGGLAEKEKSPGTRGTTMLRTEFIKAQLYMKTPAKKADAKPQERDLKTE